MALVHYDHVPYGQLSYEFGNVLNQLQRRIHRSFDTRGDADAANSSATADWTPPADIAEFGDRFVLQLDVPGVDVSAINITLEQGVLAISGERGKETLAEGLERSRVERPQGRFYRRFTLPESVDVAGVKATSRHGILEVVIPKQEKAQPRRIEIAAA